jgi:hypothetical protein
MPGLGTAPPEGGFRPGSCGAVSTSVPADRATAAFISEDFYGPFSGAPFADPHREPGGRQTGSPGREPWDEPTTESIGALPRAIFSTSPAQREKNRPWQGGWGGCGFAGPRARALGYQSAALRAGLDAFGPHTRTGAPRLWTKEAPGSWCSYSVTSPLATLSRISRMAETISSAESPKSVPSTSEGDA